MNNHSLNVRVTVCQPDAGSDLINDRFLLFFLFFVLFCHHRLRNDAAKNVRWFLSNEQVSESKLPSVQDLDLNVLSGCFIITNILMDEDCSRSVFTVSFIS